MAENFIIKWNGPAVTREIEVEMGKRVLRAAVAVQVQTQKNISKSFRGAGSQHRSNPKRKGTASKPGEFPRADLGRLRQSIFVRPLTALSAIVGTPLKYGLWLEEGTRNMQPRKYLSRTFTEMLPTITRILTGTQIK